MEEEQTILIFLILQVTLMPCVIIVNVFVLGAMVFCKQLRTPNDKRLANIVVANFLIGLVSMPVQILSYIPETRHLIFCDTHRCLFYLTCMYLPMVITYFTIVDMCVHNLFSLWIRDYYIESVFHRKVIGDVVVIWVSSLGLISIGIGNFSIDHARYGELLHNCLVSKHFPKWWFLVILCTMGVGLASMVSLPPSILCIKRRVRRNSGAKFNFEREQKNDAILLVILLVSFFILCMGMHFAIHFSKMKSVNPTGRDLEEQNRTIVLLYNIRWLGTCLNALVLGLVYALVKKKNRKAYLWMLRTNPRSWNTLQDYFNRKERENEIAETLYMIAEAFIADMKQKESVRRETRSYEDVADDSSISTYDGGLKMILHEAYNHLLKLTTHGRTMSRHERSAVEEIDEIVTAVKHKLINLDHKEDVVITALESIKADVKKELSKDEIDSSIRQVDFVLAAIKAKKLLRKKDPDAVSLSSSRQLDFRQASSVVLSPAYDHQSLTLPFMTSYDTFHQYQLNELSNTQVATPSLPASRDEKENATSGGWFSKSKSKKKESAVDFGDYLAGVSTDEADTSSRASQVELDL